MLSSKHQNRKITHTPPTAREGSGEAREWEKNAKHQEEMEEQSKREREKKKKFSDIVVCIRLPSLMVFAVHVPPNAILESEIYAMAILIYKHMKTTTLTI